ILVTPASISFWSSSEVIGVHVVLMQASFYYTTAGSYIEMRFKPDSGICKQFIMNQTSPQYTTAGSYIKGANIKAVTSPSVVGSRSLAVFVPEQGRFDKPHIRGLVHPLILSSPVSLGSPCAP